MLLLHHSPPHAPTSQPLPRLLLALSLLSRSPPQHLLPTLRSIPPRLPLPLASIPPSRLCDPRLWANEIALALEAEQHGFHLVLGPLYATYERLERRERVRARREEEGDLPGGELEAQGGDAGGGGRGFGGGGEEEGGGDGVWVRRRAVVVELVGDFLRGGGRNDGDGDDLFILDLFFLLSPTRYSPSPSPPCYSPWTSSFLPLTTRSLLVPGWCNSFEQTKRRDRAFSAPSLCSPSASRFLALQERHKYLVLQVQQTTSARRGLHKTVVNRYPRPHPSHSIKRRRRPQPIR